MKWSDFSDFRELVMIIEEQSASIHRNSGTPSHSKMIRIFEKCCGKALWPFLTERSTVRLSGGHLEGEMKKALARKEKWYV